MAEPVVHEPSHRSLLEVGDLRVQYRQDGKAPIRALDGLSFELAGGEVLGLLGESGCGKTSLALALLGLLPPEGTILSGEVRFRGRRIDQLAESDLEEIRGEEIGVVFQDPASALHPAKRVELQIAEVLRAHRTWKKSRRLEEARKLLADVELGDPRIARSYPHQLSGGQRQRVVIAQALACRPALVIADEPTASLDVTSQARILRLLRDLKHRRGTAFLYISHDPLVVAEIADRVLVMYAGHSVEEGPAEEVLNEPLHPYTRALLDCQPTLGEKASGLPGHRLSTIPGRAPGSPLPGCQFAPRCQHRIARCAEEGPGEVRQGRRGVSCFLMASE